MAASKVMQNFTPHQSADFKKTPDIFLLKILFAHHFC